MGLRIALPVSVPEYGQNVSNARSGVAVDEQ